MRMYNMIWRVSQSNQREKKNLQLLDVCNLFIVSLLQMLLCGTVKPMEFDVFS